MADERTSASSAPAAPEDAPLLVNLQIVSPSAGVGSLRFPDLPAATTIRQLKEKIREVLASRPADEDQRLIHRGRLLARDTDTLRDVLGEESIRTSDQQTIHLVVRDSGHHSAPPSQHAVSGNPTSRPDAHANSHPQHQPHVLRNAGAGVAAPSGPAPIAIPHVITAQFTQHHQSQQQEIVQRINQLQQHNHRAAMGQPTGQDGGDGGGNNASGSAADPSGGRSSPARRSSQTVTREGTGSDGQHYSFRITVNEVITRPAAGPRLPAAAAVPGADPVGQRPLSAADIHSIMHGADAARAAQTMANAMQRNTSGAPPAGMAADLANHNFNSPIHPIQPGVTTPIFPALSRNASRTATPDPSSRSVSHGSGTMPGVLQPSQARAQPTQGYPEVYILYSPTGPRGLLINNAADIYTTPAARSPSWMSSHFRSPFPYAVPMQPHIPTPHVQVQPDQGRVTIAVPGQAEVRIETPPLPQQQPLPQARDDAPPAIRRRPVAAQAGPPPAPPAGPAPQVHPGNHGAAALVAAAWPHIWLVIRLLAFAWWFSYSDPSWERWLWLGLIFLVVLSIRMGILNGVVNNAFHPVREQLEGMIPFADPDRQRDQQQQQQQQQPPNAQGRPANQNGGNGAGAEPDPARTAARLVAQRRMANAAWLRDRVRRLERAGILFLASFAPGVAERHIQQLEERERAARRAAEEARAAAQRAAEENRIGSGGGQQQQQQQPPPDVQGQQPPLVRV